MGTGTGRGDHEGIAEPVLYRPYEYIDRIERVLPAVDLFIGRVGASSVAEMTALGIPMILIPWSGVHQRQNAEAFARQGAAMLLDEQVFTAEKLGEVLVNFLENPGRLREMSARSRAMGNPEAARLIARMLIETGNTD